MQLEHPPMTPTRLKQALAAAVLVTLTVFGPSAQAQGLFSPAITVNADVVTYYEIGQRAQLYRLLRSPGDPVAKARTDLVVDRLKKQAIQEAGIDVAAEDIAAEIEAFATRAKLTRKQLAQALKEGGVAPETFRDFTRTNLGWGDFIRGRFLARSRPTEDEVDRALGRLGNGGGIRVLLSEIIIPVTPENIKQVEEVALQLSQITSISAFAAAAAKYSATDTRTRGGRMNWLPITNLPPDFRPLLLALRPGEVTAPISLPNAVALFQMRDVQEISAGVPKYSAIEFARYYIAGGRSPEAQQIANGIIDNIDTCDDLYGVAKGQPAEVLDRDSLAPGDITHDIALELAKLDENEISTALTSANGQNLVLLMLCGRTSAVGDDEDTRNDLINGLIQQRLNAFSVSYLDRLRADALIFEQ